jgi:hypothetical protein
MKLTPTPDFTIEGSIIKYWYSIGTPMFGVRPTAEVEVELTIIPSSDQGKGVYTKRYTGNWLNAGFRIVYKDADFAEIMKQSLLRMLSEFSTDPDMLAFIR